VEIVWIISGVAVLLLLIEMLAPTGGVLAVIGALGLAAAGVVALSEDSDISDALGAALITAGALSLVAAVVFGRKVIAAHRDEPVRTGWEELLGRDAVVPVGQVWIEGALWKARSDDGGSIAAGSTVRIESLDGLTLVVSELGGESDEGDREE
jgi:membrane-bound ClpP family serine protease